MKRIKLAVPTQLDFIFDFGANKGQNLTYYLLKAQTVVVVEANPILCEEINSTYRTFIQQKRLYVENRVIIDSPKENGKKTSFYVNLQKDVLSMKDYLGLSFKDWKEIQGIGECASSIINRYLQVLEAKKIYCKFDLEGFDYRALQDVFHHNIYPDFVSVELQDKRIFKLILDCKMYKSFVIVDGKEFGTKISKLHLKELKNQDLFEFNLHSAGPMGTDIPKVWISKKLMRIVLFFTGEGWRDLHASSEIPPAKFYTSLPIIFKAFKSKFVWKVRSLSIKPRF
jgi:hypothetical protein